MGKIRVKSFDESDNSELDAKKKAKKEARLAESKRAKKALRQTQGKTEKQAKTQKQSDSEPVEEVIEEKTPEETISDEIGSPSENVATKSETADETEEKTAKKSKKEKFVKTKTLSQRVNDNRKLVSKSQTYPLEKAVGLLVQFKTGKFDETVELHINVKEQGTSGTLTLPHGSGKTLRIKVADDALLADVEKGNIDFDVLVATPDMMPKLAKVARVLGPRGLMPNPKNGTVTTNPDEAVKKLSGGETRFKTEPKAPVIHLIIGRLSFGDKKILENAQTVMATIGTGKIKSAILTSTMSPGIRLQIAN